MGRRHFASWLFLVVASYASLDLSDGNNANAGQTKRYIVGILFRSIARCRDGMKVLTFRCFCFSPFAQRTQTHTDTHTHSNTANVDTLRMMANDARSERGRCMRVSFVHGSRSQNRQNEHVIITTCRNKLYRRGSSIFHLRILRFTFSAGRALSLYGRVYCAALWCAVGIHARTIVQRILRWV